MIKVAAVKPKERMNAVKDWRAELAYEKQPKINMWGLQVSCPVISSQLMLQVNNNLVQLQARILPAPRVQYDGSTAYPRDGGWNLRGNRVS